MENPPPSRLPDYQVYVMRLWQEDPVSPEAHPVWRFNLEEPLTGQRRGFSCLAELVAFLENETTNESDQ
jgi:hypothetical protein